MTQSELLAEIRDAARWCSRKGFAARHLEPLPNLMSLEAVRWINCNLKEFREMIRQEGIEARPLEAFIRGANGGDR